MFYRMSKNKVLSNFNKTYNTNKENILYSKIIRIIKKPNRGFRAHSDEKKINKINELIDNVKKRNPNPDIFKNVYRMLNSIPSDHKLIEQYNKVFQHTLHKLSQQIVYNYTFPHINNREIESVNSNHEKEEILYKKIIHIIEEPYINANSNNIKMRKIDMLIYNVEEINPDPDIFYNVFKNLEIFYLNLKDDILIKKYGKLYEYALKRLKKTH